jgi:hypothetical protein
MTITQSERLSAIHDACNARVDAAYAAYKAIVAQMEIEKARAYAEACAIRDTAYAEVQAALRD